MAGISARRVVVALDCPDARELSEFYAAMLGWQIRDDAEYSDSIADSEPAVLAAGARRHDHQPSPDGRFVVYLDPVGHPFCLCEG